MKCPICEVEFEPKRADAKTCPKPACRKKMQRINKAGEGTPQKISPPIEKESTEIIFKEEPTQIIKGEEVTAVTVHTKTDKLFAEDAYIYLDEPEEKKCFSCNTSFSTRMQFNKFCSPECKRDLLEALLANGQRQ